MGLGLYLSLCSEMRQLLFTAGIQVGSFASF